MVHLPDLAALARSVRDDVISLQRRIHADPEIGFDTVRTAALAASVLRDAGLEVRERIGRTGVVADLNVPGARHRVAFRADMDALPITEETDLPHKSRNAGMAHLCGHDAHSAMLLGAAKALARARTALPVSLRFIFQPNEECLPGGAPSMIRDGCLEGVDRIYGMHVWPLLETGKMGVRSGPIMAQPDMFRVEVTGSGGHAASPHATRDPVLGVALMIAALQAIVARNVDPRDAAVLSVTQVHAGSAYNVIPPRAEFSGGIRSLRKEVGDRVRARLREVVAGVARAAELAATVEITEGYPVVVNDADACRAAESALAGTIPLGAVDPSMVGEDFAYYLQRVPGAFLLLGNYDEAKGIVHFCHHPRFMVDDAALDHGVRSWLALAFGV